jgi:hypothetical protein
VTVELHDDETTDGEEFCVAWLAPLGGETRIRVNDDTPLPRRRVQEIFADEDCNLFTGRSVVSINIECDANVDHAEVAAKKESDRTHRRMTYLAKHPDTVVTLKDGRQVTVDYVDVVQKPIWIETDDDQILCKQGRYEFGFTFVAVS